MSNAMTPELRKIGIHKELRRFEKKTPQPPLILRYGLALLAVTAALIINQLLNVHLVGAPAMLFLCSLMFSALYGGIKPSLVALPLAVLAFAYYFMTPVNSWAVDVKEIPRLLLFVLSAIFVISLCAAHKRASESLGYAGDVLAGTVEELKQTNVALRAEITERKRAEDALRRSEDHLRLVIDTIPAMVFTAFPDGSVDFVSQQWLQYMGLSLENVQGWSWEDTIHPEDRARSSEHWRSTIASGQASENELRVRGADGVYRWILGRFVPLRDESGKIVKWYGASTDIDNRKRAEEQLKATTGQLRALSARVQSAREEEATRIAREIHDELGSALSSIKWDLEEIDEAISESTELPRLAAAHKNIRSMITMTETTLETVRRITSELRPIALDEFGLLEALRYHTEQFQVRTGIEVNYQGAPESVDLNREHSSAVFRIFQEALTNILRHANATKVDITASVEAGVFLLRVSDNGRGITDAEKFGPRSLGLIGMRERANLIDGEVDIQGTEGRGTVVTVRIPLVA